MRCLFVALWAGTVVRWLCAPNECLVVANVSLSGRTKLNGIRDLFPAVVPLEIFATIYMAIYTFVFDEDNVGRKYAILSKVMQMLGVQRFVIYSCSLLAPRLTLPLAVRHVSHVERWSFVVR